jgi:nitrous oxide reductase accessory protein NosL
MIRLISFIGIVALLSGCVAKDKVEPAEVAQKTVKQKQVAQKTVAEKEVAKPMPKKKKMCKGKMFQTVDKKDATLVQEGKNKNSCAVCGMNLVKFYKTSHMAEYNGKPVQYCSIHCLEHHLEDGVEVKNPRVVDVSTLKFIPVLEAYYVVGSDLRGTMSRVSKYAFSSLEDAKKFQAKHGGKIMDFRAALEKAKEDFKKGM